MYKLPTLFGNAFGRVGTLIASAFTSCTIATYYSLKYIVLLTPTAAAVLRFFPVTLACLNGDSDANIDPPIHGACRLCALYPGSCLVGCGMTLASMDAPAGETLSRSSFSLSTNPGITVVPPATTTDPSRSGLMSLRDTIHNNKSRARTLTQRYYRLVRDGVYFSEMDHVRS